MTFLAPYRGRFAPSPTGPLHFGSLIAAMGSYLQAKHQNGEWLIRIDDIDPPRQQKGASEHILKTLEDFGFEWDADVLYQSNRHKRYQEVVDILLEHETAYFCSCSRKSILKNSGYKNKHGEIVYPGFCRNNPLVKSENSSDYSTRLRCDDKPISFIDNLMGKQSFNIELLTGDFILQRRDGYFSYHLACGIDDAEQNITEVVRGSDLLKCTPYQIHIQQSLNLRSPQYCHLPIVISARGQKLSKQHHAEPINPKNSVDLLYKTLKFLGQTPPIELIDSSQEDIWHWAKTHWRLDLVPQKHQIMVERKQD